jgi:murein peptide amidase A
VRPSRLLVAALLALLALPGSAPAAESVLLGRSTQGREIRAVRLGDPDAPRKALVVGAIHGNETAGMRVTRMLRKRVSVSDAVDLWVVETVNPDGVARGTRGNARGVDLNRNFPRRWRRSARGPKYSGSRALSERESRIVTRWVERIRPTVTVWYHQPWGVVLLPCEGPAPIERRYMAVADFPGQRCRGAGLRGTASSWQNHKFPGTRTFVVELPGGSIGAAAAERHARAVAAVAAGR